MGSLQSACMPKDKLHLSLVFPVASIADSEALPVFFHAIVVQAHIGAAVVAGFNHRSPSSTPAGA